MKQSILTLLITIFSITSYAQVNFEEGYLITNSNLKIDCLIKNKDWSNNPTNIQYKTSENSSTESVKIESILEFSITGKSNYKRFNVLIDRSNDNVNSRLNDLSTKKEPEFKQEQLLLNVLIEGKANLYLYREGDFRRYFYKVDNSEIEQLIFKKYELKGKVAKNNRYKQQLWTTMKCSGITMQHISRTDYTKSDLTSFFINYNKCNNPDYKITKTKTNKGEFHIAVKPGLSMSSVEIVDLITPYRNVDFGEKTGLRLGVEIEWIVPFHNNKWAVFVEPTYQSFKSENTTLGRITMNPNATGIQQAYIDYSTIELPIGFKHYLFLNNNSKIFLNAAIIVDIPYKSTIEYEKDLNLVTKSGYNFSFGIGYKYKNKYSIEYRHHTKRDLITHYSDIFASLKSNSIVLGVNIF